ncbi:MAG: hypothetical protein U1E84_11175 [Rhodoferax sp.]
MPTSLRPAGDIVKVVNPLNIKRDVYATLNKSQIASWIMDLGQVNHLATINGHTNSAYVACSSIMYGTNARSVTKYHGIIGYISGYDRPGADHRTPSNRYAWQDDSPSSNGRSLLD